MKLSLPVVCASLFLAFTGLVQAASSPFPTSPDAHLTPGSLCGLHRTVRYPERIPYCDRSVDSGLKEDIIDSYDARLGYQIAKMPRGEFKIDHYIPLCMGGSNERDNLWPQHSSVYRYTDPLEQACCLKMADGRLKQREAVEIIKKAKADLSQAGSLFKYVQGL